MATSDSWQLRLSWAIAFWASVVLLAAFWGLHIGLSGTPFAVALGVAAALFGFEFFLSAPGVQARANTNFGGAARLLFLLVTPFAVLVYSLDVAGDTKTTLLGAAYALIPGLLLAAPSQAARANWEDYAAVLLIWLPVEFQWVYRLFPYPPQLTHTLAVLTAVSVGVAGFVLVRRLEGIGYAVEWRRGFLLNFLFHFSLFAAIAIPLGLKMHFLVWSPSFMRGHFLPLDALGILLFTAWPEEFLFRGLLQNLLTKTFQNQWAALAIASIIFGLSHVFHAPYPNWKYVFLATIAGLFYGHAWMKSKSLLPAVLVHGLVDFSWHILFR